MKTNPLAALVFAGGAIVASIVHDSLKIRRERIRREEIVEELEINLSLLTAAEDEMTKRIRSDYYKDKSYSEFMSDLEFAFNMPPRN